MFPIIYMVKHGIKTYCHHFVYAIVFVISIRFTRNFEKKIKIIVKHKHMTKCEYILTINVLRQNLI